jgi:hypothetical protein
MSEVDRLSNSGLYPMLPIADRRGSNASKDESGRKAREDANAPEKPAEATDPAAPRPPKSLIDEYA